MCIKGSKAINVTSLLLRTGPLNKHNTTDCYRDFVTEDWVSKRMCRKKLQLKLDAEKQTLRSPPFSLRQAVTDERKDLQEKGIKGHINASPWVFSIVVTQRKKGEKHMC